MSLLSKLANYIKIPVFTYLLLVLVFLTTISLSGKIPSKLLTKNIGKTVDILKQEGNYPSYGLSWRQITLDNFTDTLMFNTAYSVDSQMPIKSALVNSRYDGRIDSTNQVSNLEKLYLKQEVVKVGYERYWHGYLLYLRPLLVVTDYSGIRIIISIVLYSSCFAFLYLLWKRGRMETAIAFLIGLILVDFFYIGRSIQFSSVFLIGILSSVYLIKAYKKNYNLPLFFFVVGALTSFFDMLTAPLVSLGLVLIVAYSLGKKSIKDLFMQCIAWSAGYLLLWYSKWFLVQTLFVPGAVKTAINQIVNRTVIQADSNFSHVNALKLNIFQLIGYHRMDKIIILSVFMLYVLFMTRYFQYKREKMKPVIPLLFIGVLPIAWFLIAANHSYLHVWFTYRTLLLSVVSAVLISNEFTDWIKFKKDMHSLLSGIFFAKSAAKRGND